MAIIPTDFVVRGLIAARPAAGIAGRIYVVTDAAARRVTYDDGAVWQDVYVDTPYVPGGGGGGGDLSLLYHSELAVAGTFTYNPVDATFRSLLLKWILRSDQAGAQRIYLRLNTDAGANYGWVNLSASGVASSVSNNGGDVGAPLGSAPGTGDAANRPGMGQAQLVDYATTDWQKQVDSLSTYWNTGGVSQALERIGTVWVNTAAVTRLDVLPAAGLFVAKSKLAIYGLK